MAESVSQNLNRLDSFFRDCYKNDPRFEIYLVETFLMIPNRGEQYETQKVCNAFNICVSPIPRSGKIIS